MKRTRNSLLDDFPVRGCRGQMRAYIIYIKILEIIKNKIYGGLTL